MSDLGPGRPLIVPVFIPFHGCPHRCVYCDQETITSLRADPVSPSSVTRIIEQAVRSSRFDPARNPEIAFYGGTFTGLPRKRMQELLEAASPFLRSGMFTSIRLSTRPDALDEDALFLLGRWGVKTVELGVQSMDDEVLKASRRGHTAGDTFRSFQLLREQNFKIGVQLMPGLPGDSRETFLATVDRVVELKPDMVRLYPTVVIQGTELAHWYLSGIYKPWSLEKAVGVCSESVLCFERSSIPVIRIGLMAPSSLADRERIVAGPWHEAFGHMVRSAVYHRKIEVFLSGWERSERIRLQVHPKEVPLMRGFKNHGIRDVEAKTGASVRSVLPDDSIARGHVRVEAA